MDWSSGSSIAIDMIQAIRADKKIPADSKSRIYRALYASLCGCDWGAIEEALGLDPLFDAIADADNGGGDE